MSATSEQVRVEARCVNCDWEGAAPVIGRCPNCGDKRFEPVQHSGSAPVGLSCGESGRALASHAGSWSWCGSIVATAKGYRAALSLELRPNEGSRRSLEVFASERALMSLAKAEVNTRAAECGVTLDWCLRPRTQAVGEVELVAIGVELR